MLLPLPDGPMIAAASPRSSRSETSAQDRQRAAWRRIRLGQRLCDQHAGSGHVESRGWRRPLRPPPPSAPRCSARGRRRRRPRRAREPGPDRATVRSRPSARASVAGLDQEAAAGAFRRSRGTRRARLHDRHAAGHRLEQEEPLRLVVGGRAPTARRGCAGTRPCRRDRARRDTRTRRPGPRPPASPSHRRGTP